MLYLVFQKIDLVVFKDNLAETDLLMVCVGLFLGPIAVSIGALRWCYMLRKSISNEINLSFSYRHYWIGVALALFGLGSLGCDAYRIVKVGRIFGHYTMNVGVIVAEKAMTLFTCTLLIILLYPVLSFSADSLRLARLFDGAVIILILGFVFAILVVITRHYRLVRSLLEGVERYLAKLVSNAMKKISLSNSLFAESVSIRDLFLSMSLHRQWPITILLSFFMQLVTAIGSQIYFLAVGYEISFWVNLFVMPIMVFIFLLPGSFGGLGVREVAYIFLYGLFGVPAETAVLVSFLALAGMLLNSLIGAMVMALQPNTVGVVQSS